jgi:hypothetical protein
MLFSFLNLQEKIKKKSEQKMGIIYKFYEPDKGYEQIQAELFNNAMTKYGTAGNATADEIKERYKIEGFDNKGVQYAFDADEPVAYIQTRKDEANRQIFIGYPWSKADCPENVKDYMFKSMVNYLYSRDPDYKIVCGTIQEPWKDVHEFVKKYNGTVDRESKFFLLDIDTLSSLDNSGFTSRIGSLEEDEEALYKLCMSEPGFGDSFPTEDAVKAFAKNALKDLETILIYKGEELVSAGAVVSYEPGGNKTINTRYTATKNYNFDNWKAFVIVMAKKLKEKGLGGMKFTLFDRQPEHLEFYDKNSSGFQTNVTYAIPKPSN